MSERLADVCVTCSLGGKSLHIAAWDISAGVVQRMFSCDTGVQESSVASDSGGGGSGLCLLRNSHILSATRSLPFIYAWNIKKVFFLTFSYFNINPH